MGRDRNIVLGAGGLGLGAVAVALGVAAVRQAAGWRAADEMTAEELVRLPSGGDRVVTASDGAALAVTVVGDGPTVVLAHGWTETRGIWAGVARRLVERGRRVVMYDQRGHGDSTVGADGITVERLGLDLRDILVALDARDAVVGGHSMGGMSVMALLDTDPEMLLARSRALFLISTAAGGLGMPRVIEAFVGRSMASPAVSRMFGSSMGVRMARGSVGRRPRYSHLRATASMVASTDPAARAGCFRAMSGMDLHGGLSSACGRLPVTIVVGDRDRLTPLPMARRIADAFPGAELIVVPDAGHQLPFEEPDLLAELIADAAPAGRAPARPGALAAT